MILLKFKYFSLADAEFNFLQLGCSLLPDAFILCFSGPKSKNSDIYFEPGWGFPKIWQPLLDLKAFRDAPYVL